MHNCKTSVKKGERVCLVFFRSTSCVTSAAATVSSRNNGPLIYTSSYLFLTQIYGIFVIHPLFLSFLVFLS